jgi:hypothetical protein
MATKTEKRAARRVFDRFDIDGFTYGAPYHIDKVAGNTYHVVKDNYGKRREVSADYFTGTKVKL